VRHPVIKEEMMKPTAFAATMAFTRPLLATTSMTALAVTTDEFVNKVTTSNMFEIKSGKLASEKAKHEDVKAYGEDMVEDHTGANEKLMELVKDEKIDVRASRELDEQNKENLNKLQNASGEKFDAIYVPMQVLAHEKAVNLFQDYSESGENEALKDWADGLLPNLKEHLGKARDLNDELSESDKMAAADTDTQSENAKAMNDKSMDEKSKDNAAMNDTASDKAASDRDAMSAKDNTDKKTMDKVTDETDVDDAGMADEDKKTAEKAKPKPPTFDYVTRQEATDWTSQALVGRTAMNLQGETLGEINNVILNEKGRVVAVTVGVGGFLGIGEKDVGVPFEALSFKDEDAVESDDDETAANDEEMDADHDDEVVVIEATKEQLENAPDFVWLDE
jgi:putative membrane protein